MAVVIVNHRVKDYLEWKRNYEADRARRESAGMKELALGRRMDAPDHVYIVYEFTDNAAFQKMLGEEDFMQRMEDSGVIGVPELIPLV